MCRRFFVYVSKLLHTVTVRTSINHFYPSESTINKTPEKKKKKRKKKEREKKKKKKEKKKEREREKKKKNYR